MCWFTGRKTQIAVTQCTGSSHFWYHVWMLLAECSESISLSHTVHIMKCPDSIVGKRQRSQAFLIYSYVISTAIGTWHAMLQSQHTGRKTPSYLPITQCWNLLCWVTVAAQWRQSAVTDDRAVSSAFSFCHWVAILLCCQFYAPGQTSSQSQSILSDSHEARV